MRPDNVRTMSDADRDRFVDFAVERSASSHVDPAVRRDAAPPFHLILADGSNVWVRDYVLPWNEDSLRTWTVFDDEAERLHASRHPTG